MPGLSIELPKSIALAHLPTPIEELKVPEEFAFVPSLYVKRDDLTGTALSGNKVRKLEFCMAEALSLGADTVITCGGVQSNHARATAVAAARLGLGSILVLRGDPPEEIDGNLFLDSMVGARKEYITEDEWERIDEIMKALAAEEEKQGHRAYIIPEGASYPTGVFGYIKAAEEIVNQSDKLNLRFSEIVIAVGSGGTYAGLWHGLKMLDRKIPILGINVLKEPHYFKRRISEISESFVEKYSGLAPGTEVIEPIDESQIEIEGGYEGPAYAVPDEEGIRVIKAFAKSGIFLDPAYTSKAMLGIIGEAKKGRWSKNDNILFIHTGGIFSLFPWKKKLLE